MHCPHCGKENPDNLKYCVECGEPLHKEGATGKDAGDKVVEAEAAGAGAAESVGNAKLSRADRKSAKARRQARAKAAKRAERRADAPEDDASKDDTIDLEEQDKKAAAARKRTQARRAAAAGTTDGMVEAAGEADAIDSSPAVTTELTGRGVRTRRATQDTGSVPEVGTGTRTLDDIAAEQHGGSSSRVSNAQHASDGYRPAVYNYSKEPAKKRSAAGPIAAGLIVAALAAGAGYYALNANPFAPGEGTSSSASSAVSSSSEKPATSSSSSEADAKKDTIDFENDTFQVELPQRWKDKLSFAESNGAVDVKDIESGTVIARLLTGEEVTPTDIGGQIYSLGEAKGKGAAIPVSLFVTDVDAEGKPVAVGATGEKSALDQYLQTTAKVFASYIKVKNGDDFTTAKFESNATSNDDGSASGSGTSNGSGSGSGDNAGSGSGSGSGSGDGTTWSGGAGSSIAPADNNGTNGGSESGSTDNAGGQAAPAPAPAPEPAPAPAPAADSGSSPFWTAQAGAFKARSNAEAYAQQLRNAGFSPEIVVSNEWTGFNQATWYLVVVGRYGDKGSAQSTVNQILNSGFTQAFAQYSGDKK